MGAEKKCTKCLVLPCCREKAKTGTLHCAILGYQKVNFNDLSRIMESTIFSITYPRDEEKEKNYRDKDKEREGRAFGTYMRRHLR